MARNSRLDFSRQSITYLPRRKTTLFLTKMFSIYGPRFSSPMFTCLVQSSPKFTVGQAAFDALKNLTQCDVTCGSIFPLVSVALSDSLLTSLAGPNAVTRLLKRFGHSFLWNSLNFGEFLNEYAKDSTKPQGDALCKAALQIWNGSSFEWTNHV